MHYVLVFVVLICVNVLTWSFQGGGKINVLSAESVERGKHVPKWTPLLTLEGFERAMSAPPAEGILVLDFHGSTLPDGRHEGIIDDHFVRFEEKDIPTGVYVASCRHPLGVSLEAASKYVFEEVEERNRDGGFLAPKGHVLQVSQRKLFDYWSYRPYKHWLHLVVTAVTSLLLLLFYWNKEPVLDWGAKKGETAAWVIAGERDLKPL